MTLHVLATEPVIELASSVPPASIDEPAGDTSAWAFELGDPVSAEFGPNGYVIERRETLERDRLYLIGDKRGNPFPRRVWYRAGQLGFREPESGEVFGKGFERWNLRVDAMARAQRCENVLAIIGDRLNHLRAHLMPARLVAECAADGLSADDTDAVQRLLGEAVNVLDEIRDRADTASA